MKNSEVQTTAEFRRIYFGELTCAHCGQVAPNNPLKNTIAEENTNDKEPTPWFCCTGCQAVYQILHGAGLAKYYEIKKDAFCFTQATPIQLRDDSFAQWDSPERIAQIYIEGVHCSACLWLIEQLPMVNPAHVRSAQLDLGHSLLKLQLTNGGQLSVVAKTLVSWGYHPHLVKNQAAGQELLKNENRRRLLDVGVAGALAGNIMLMSIALYAGASLEYAQYFAWISAALATVAVFYSGRSFFQIVWRSFKQHQFSVDVPILLAIVVAYFYSVATLLMGRVDVYFDSLSMLIFLLLGSRYFLARLRQYGLNHRDSFQLLAPQTRFEIGELMTLMPNAEIIFDGRIRAGSGYFDQATFTGESWPTLLRAGDPVYAGTRFIESFAAAEPILIEVIKVGEDTRLAKIVSDVQAAQRERSSVEKSFDRWARQLLAVVVLIAAVSFSYWALQGRWSEALHRTLALLIVTCPCALALATPLAQSLMLRKALRRGLLIKDVEAFDKAMHVKKVYFDKTGTLTKGQLAVSELSVFSQDKPQLRALVWPSRHPISRAIYHGLGVGEISVIENWQELPSLGVEGQIAGEKWQLIRAKSISEKESRPAVELFVNEQPRGHIFLTDELREETKHIVYDLNAQGMAMGILSGDRRSVVQTLAKQLGLKSDVHDELTPEMKAKVISDSEARDEKTFMIGDGINDALAMSRATLSMAVQGGIEEASKNATITLLRPGLHGVTDFFAQARQLQKIHRLNFTYSTFYNFISGTLAIFGYMHPLLAAIVMPISAATVFIVTAYQLREKEKSEV